MTKREKLLAKARRTPAGLKFEELCLLAESAGFEFRNQKGSHRIYKHPGCGALISLQPDGSAAKKYQVLQLLGMIDHHGLMKGE